MTRAVVTLLLSCSLAGCAATTTKLYLAAGSSPLCGPDADPLGSVIVLPEAAWRPDQKDVEERIAIAERAISRAFEDLPCGHLEAPGGIRAFAPWSNRPESDILSLFASRSVDTIVLLRVEELTPNLLITLSLPFLWSGTNEADLRVRALATDPARVLLDLRIDRTTGGPFHLRPASWSEPELEAALREVLVGNRGDD
jgi:hypothetical protein